MPDAGEPKPTQMVAPTEVLKGLLYGSIGLGAAVVADTPARLKQARNDLVAARFIGEMAVTQGVAQIRARRDGGTTSAPVARARRPVADVAADETPEPEPTEDSSEAETPPAADGAPEPASVDVGELPIPNYDTVPAIDVVAQLDDLTAHERSIVEAYERAHRGRRTILGKLARLESS